MQLFPAGVDKNTPLDTIQDRIAAYMVGKVEEHALSDQDRAIKNRWINIWALLRNHHSPSQAVDAHLLQYEQSGDPISRRTAYTDLRNATDLWGSHTQISRQAQLVLLQDYATQAMRKGFEEHNLPEINKSVANLVKIAALQEPFDQDEGEAHTYVLEIKLASGSQKTISLDKINKLGQDEYHQVIEAIEEDEIDGIAMRDILERREQNGQEGA